MRRALLALWALVASPLIGFGIAVAGAGVVALLVLPPALAAVGAIAARSSIGTVAAWAAAGLGATILFIAIFWIVSPPDFS